MGRVAQQSLLLGPLLNSMARAHFQHYDQLRRDWETHRKSCALCERALLRKNDSLRCKTGVELYSKMQYTRNQSLRDRFSY